MIMKAKLLILLILTISLVFGQSKSSKKNLLPNKEGLIEHRHSLGSSFFILGNFLDDSPEYYLLTYGYQLTKKDRIFTEFNTWKYAEPLGTYVKSEEFYPGFVRAWGIGFGYQRLHWKGLFTSFQGTPFLKQYQDTNDNQTEKGFQLYLQFVAGYRFKFFRERFYVEPAYALKYWPIDTNFPVDFAKVEEGRPKHIFEPSLNFGFKF